MPYLNKIIADVKNIKAYEVLTNYGFTMKKAQRVIDKKTLFCNNQLVNKKNEILNGLVEIVVYEPDPKGLKPIYENEDFAIFNKPSGVLSHPNGRNCKYCLYDEIWHLYSFDACVAHRLDKETSGIIVVAKNKSSLNIIKTMFEKRQIKKSYLALVEGQIFENFEVNAKIAPSSGQIKIAMMIDESGKEAVTKFEVLKTMQNSTLLKCIPLTGRQHQIRLHLYHYGHRILGDPIYGVDLKTFEDILDEKISLDQRVELTKFSRLCLHASQISFTYKEQDFSFSCEHEF